MNSELSREGGRERSLTTRGEAPTKQNGRRKQINKTTRNPCLITDGGRVQDTERTTHMTKVSPIETSTPKINERTESIIDLRFHLSTSDCFTIGSPSILGGSPSSNAMTNQPHRRKIKFWFGPGPLTTSLEG